MLFDGYLHLPGIQVLLPSANMIYFDIHGLGREVKDDLPGLLHGVVDRENAREFYRM